MRNFKRGLFSASLWLLALSLSACAGETKDITQILKEGVVKITYGDKPGHATGFFIESDGNSCTVLTVAHAAPEDIDVLVTPYDNELLKIIDVKRADNDDLAVMTFNVEGEESCPYTSLKLGDSNRLKIDDSVRMAGYPERTGAQRLVLQIPSGKVTNIESPPLPNGYAISYDVLTVGGMSGAPVVNAKGRVIGVHGLTDSELVSLGRAQQSSLSDDHEDEIEEAEERVEGLARINHFKWGIPIQTFVRQQSVLLAQGKNVSELIEEADELRNQKRYKEAIDLYDEALTIDSQQSAAWYGQGFSLVEIGRYEDAIASYDKALEIDPDNADAWYNRGISLEKLERYEDAIVSYDKAIEIDPDYAIAWNNRGVSLRNLNRYEDAIASYDKALEIDPDDADAWNNRGNSLHILERYEDAITSYDKAIEIDPVYSKAWNNRGVSLHILERYEDAIASYDKAIEIDPDDADAWYNRGNSLEKLERYEDVIASYDKAIEIDPVYSKAWNNRGVSLHILERYEDAIASYDKAIEIDPDYSKAWNNRGWALEKLGKEDNALKSYKKALEVDPNNARAKTNLNNLENKLN